MIDIGKEENRGEKGYQVFCTKGLLVMFYSSSLLTTTSRAEHPLLWEDPSYAFGYY